MSLTRGLKCCAFQQPQGTPGLPVRPSSMRAHSLGISGSNSSSISLFPTPSTSGRVSTLPPPAPAAQPPVPLPIIHSTAYLQQTQQLVVVDIPQQYSLQASSRTMQDVSLQRNALQWALDKVDGSLDEIEQNPTAMQQALYDVSQGPVGQATTKGVQAAAKLTMTATLEAAKVAAPVGKWAVSQGFKAAVGLAGYTLQQQRARQQEERKGAKAPKKQQRS